MARSTAAETTIPFDIIPRVIAWDEWEYLHKGLVQRVRALNAFLADAYGEREICRAGVIPEQQVLMNAEFVAMAQGLELPGGVHAHIAGIDLVRVGEKDFYVLEDNVRTPSGVSYVLENREVDDAAGARAVLGHARAAGRRLFRGAAGDLALGVVQRRRRAQRRAADAGPSTTAPISSTPSWPTRWASSWSRARTCSSTRAASTCARRAGPQRVDVIYRRVDDDFLDPLAMRPDSLLGVAGLLRRCARAGVNIVNALGNGVADDKSTYTYVPEMVRFYLGEEPILHNVPTWRCDRADDLKYVLEHLAELVVKEVHGSGGKGMLVGPTSSKRRDRRVRGCS